MPDFMIRFSESHQGMLEWPTVSSVTFFDCKGTNKREKMQIFLCFSERAYLSTPKCCPSCPCCLTFIIHSLLEKTQISFGFFLAYSYLCQQRR